MKMLSHHQHQNINPGEVVTRDTSRDLMTTNSIELLNDSFLQTSSLYDVTDTSQLLPWDQVWIQTANDSGVFLSQSDDQWSLPGIATDINTCYDVTVENTITAAAQNPRYDVIEHVTVDYPCRSGIPCDDEAAVCQCSRWAFTDDQVRCICVALQQKRDVDKLETFLSQLQTCQRHSRLLDGSQVAHRHTRVTRLQPRCTDSPTTCQVDQTSADVADAVLSSVAQVDNLFINGNNKTNK